MENGWETISYVQDVYIKGILKLLSASGEEMTWEEKIKLSALKPRLPKDILKQYEAFLKKENMELINSARQILPFFEQYA